MQETRKKSEIVQNTCRATQILTYKIPYKFIMALHNIGLKLSIDTLFFIIIASNFPINHNTYSVIKCIDSLTPVHVLLIDVVTR